TLAHITPAGGERITAMKKWQKQAKTSTRVSHAVRSMVHVADVAKPQRGILLPGRALRATASSTRSFLREVSTGSPAPAGRERGRPPSEDETPRLGARGGRQAGRDHCG